MTTTRWITPGLLLTLMLALVIVPAGATETLDQSQAVSQSPTAVSSSAPKGQLFTAGLYGILDRVSLYLENYTASPPAGAVLTVSVQTVIDGLPSGRQIGSGTIPLGGIPAPGHAGWVDVGIRGALVHAGTQYALVLQTSNAFGSVHWWYAYKNDFGSKYAGGEMVFNDGTAWRTDGRYDFTFQTYVIPDVLDQSQPRRSASGDFLGSTLGMIFTAGRSGFLDRAYVRIERTSTVPVEVTIQTVEGGYPSGTVIGQGSIPAVPPWEEYVGWRTANISGAAVTAGTQYALVLHYQGQFLWWGHSGVPDFPGYMVVMDSQGWNRALNYSWQDAIHAMFETYVVEPVVFAPPPPPATITPCSAGICPSASGLVNRPDSPARVTSLVQFWEKPDGRIEGILHFDDSRTGSFALKGCGTNSDACRLTVTQFACTDQHAITIAGTYTPKGEEVGGYQLTLRGVKGEVGNFTLTAGNYTYTVTHKGIADVTCPPAAEAAGLR